MMSPHTADESIYQVEATEYPTRWAATKYTLFFVVILALLPILPSNHIPMQVDDFNFTLEQGEYLGFGVRNLVAGDNFSVIFQVTGGNVNFYFMDEPNYDEWKYGLAYTAVHSVSSVTEYTWSVIVSANGTWVMCFDHDGSDTITVRGYIALNTELPSLDQSADLLRNVAIVSAAALVVAGVSFILYRRRHQVPGSA